MVDSAKPDPEAGDTTALLAAARAGDRSAYDRVFARVYDELRRVASRQAARFGGSSSHRGDNTLSTTALVHEAYVKLAGDDLVAANDRLHFFALAARAMRHILIDDARRGGRKKRGGDSPHVAIEALAFELGAPPGGATPEELLGLDRALGRLSEVDDQLGQLVEWRFFAGLTLAEIADLTGTSERTLKRDWVVARAFLLRDISGEAAGGTAPSTPA